MWIVENMVEIVVLRRLRVVPTYLATLSAVVPASAPAIFLVPVRRRVPAPCPAGICVLFRQFHSREKSRPHPGLPTAGRQRYVGFVCMFRPSAPRPSHIPAAPCCLGRARPTLTPGRSVHLVQADINAASHSGRHLCARPLPMSRRPMSWTSPSSTSSRVLAGSLCRFCSSPVPVARSSAGFCASPRTAGTRLSRLPCLCRLPERNRRKEPRLEGADIFTIGFELVKTLLLYII
jgi:hypothetical protein